MNITSLKLTQVPGLPGKKQVDTYSHWIFIYKTPLASALRNKSPYFDKLEQRRKQLGKKVTDSEVVKMDLPNQKSSHVSFTHLAADTGSFELLNLARKLVAEQIQARARTIAVACFGFDQETGERIYEAILTAACSAAIKMPDYKKTGTASSSLKQVRLFGIKVKHNFKRAMAEAYANGVARFLSRLPPNELTPAAYLGIIKDIAADKKLACQFYDEKYLQKKQAGAFLAVTRASPERDAGIVKLSYRSGKRGRNSRKLILVGKGICFDTGGVNLKPAKFMYGMHEDMQGSAVALGTLLAFAGLQVDFDVECWLALATNHIGPKAYKPNDIVTAADGTTIEIVHSDAEGRMVLADTLTMASWEKPTLIIDYATLTGACVYSLGNAYSGIFTNRDEWIMTLIDAGRDSGERVWPFPLDDDYDEPLKSQHADIKQCAVEGEADHILAARFLKRFVKEDTSWIHIDLSSSSRKGGLAHIPTDTTGFGIRFTLNLLLDKAILEK